MGAIEIPGYKIKQTLGVGGQATVYLAIQEGFDREVALKVMSPALATDPTFGERFIREAKIVARMSFPGIVTVYDVGEHDGFYFLAMEYFPGTDLRQRINKGVKSRFALQVVEQVAKSLHYAHEKGYIHRDVKSENILFRESGEAVLTDFGIAKASNSSTQMTVQGKLIGTPQYMSPEQCRGKKLDARSDIYSLGIVLFEMLTQDVPFDGEDSVGVCLQHVTKAVPKLPVRHKHLQWLLNKMLAKDPAKRFNSAKQLIDDLTEFNSGNLAVTTPDTDESTSASQWNNTRDDQATLIAEDGITADLSVTRRASQADIDEVKPKKSRVGLWALIVLLVAMAASYSFWWPVAKPIAKPLLAQFNLLEEESSSLATAKLEVNNQLSPNADSEDLLASNNQQISSDSDAEQLNDSARQRRIADLLVETESLLALKSLSLAQQKKLIENYQQVLALDAANETAKKGLASVYELLFSQASTALTEGNESQFIDRQNLVRQVGAEASVLDAFKLEWQNYQRSLSEQQQATQRANRIASLINRANTAIEQQRFAFPQSNNANDYLKQILELDPNNQQAKAQLAVLSSTVESKFEQALTNTNASVAQVLLEQLQTLRPNAEETQQQQVELDELKQELNRQEQQRAQVQKQKQAEQERAALLADPMVQLRIQSRLDSANQALSDGRLVGDGDSALAKFDEVLEIDSASPEAIAGRQQVIDNLVELVKTAIRDGDKTLANENLQTLAEYFPNHPSLPVLRQQIVELDIVLEQEPVISSDNGQ